MKVAVIVFPGSNCDHDLYYAYKHILKLDTEFVWHEEQDLRRFDLITLPGGFSYGDYLRSGAIASYSPVMKAVRSEAKRGKYVFGICNGFQVLTEHRLLDGGLVMNNSQKFCCQNQYIKAVNKSSFVSRLSAGKSLLIPIAHKEGRFVADDDTIKRLSDNDQILFQYSDLGGNVTDSANPNGSINSIAGILSKEKNVAGMMPHPERAVEKIFQRVDGIEILTSFLG
ncbi:MAG: phosphoribosylformylglycinamidine synthase subunit PurQ [Nitrospinota bacterium]